MRASTTPTTNAIKVLLIFLLLAVADNQSFAQIYASSLDKIPSDWSKPIFELSKEYPNTLPIEKNLPWLKYDFTTQPKEYMNAVLLYFIEGNNEVNWVVQNNKIRKWYHAPSMSWQPAKRPYGREFIHGLTRERNSPPKELFPTQTYIIQNWAVGFYNPIGAYTFGKVWSDTTNLNVENVSFPEGTVAAKLLFTSAPLNEVPFVEGSLEWEANIHTRVFGTTDRSPQTVRLLQLDIAIKDARADSLTGWVFGTFAYNTNATGETVWEKLVPVGLMWGNDPRKFKGENLTETWINPEFLSLFKFPNGQPMHIGFKGRLNGPVDNPVSSCLSCHSTSQVPQFRPMTPNVNKPGDLAEFFRNVKSNESFDGLPTSKSLNYSLQLAGGVAAAIANGSSTIIASKSTAMEESVAAENVKEIEYYITSMEDDARFASTSESEATASADQEVSNSPLSKINSWVWIIGGIIIVLVVLAFLMRKNR